MSEKARENPTNNVRKALNCLSSDSAITYKKK